MTRAMIDRPFAPHLLLPHTGTARLLTEVVRAERGVLVATGQIPAAHPLTVAKNVPCFLGLEMGAQAAAVLEALTRKEDTGDRAPRVGYLVGVRAATFLRPELPVETPVTITASLEGSAPPLAIYRITIAVAGVEFLTATLSTHSGTSLSGSSRTVSGS
jgi:predicted hotdog family 3-hydroxylacyl-ACP dehydratase